MWFGFMTTFLTYKSMIKKKNMKIFLSEYCDEQVMKLNNSGLSCEIICVPMSGEDVFWKSGLVY